MTAALEMPGLAGSRTTALLLPREHGAWAMLLLPFFSALILARQLRWEAAPAFVMAAGAFAVREPLVALGRQKWVWRERRPESEQALRSLGWYGAAIAVSGAALLWRLPFVPLAALGAAAALLTALAVHQSVRNRQRSVLLQLASAAGLTASCLLAWLAAQARWDARIWLLWGLQMAHSAAALVAVHARLEARIARRRGAVAPSIARPAAAAVFLLAALAAVLAWGGRPGLALAAAFSAAVRAADLARLRFSLETPLRRVGQRELALSCVFSVLALAGLW
ncbi:MAG TPA: YwiC-like family protein [Bryobacterales bacterium]|nr:YwiC-like family protein [Bryobacterales bacterium]